MDSNRKQLPEAEVWRAGMEFLARGEYETGWRLWEKRPISMGGRADGKPTLAFPEWDGRPISSLLILPEQGLGDQIMFARYAPFLQDKGVATTIMCHPLLTRLFGSLGVPVLNAQGRVALPKVDAWALSPSLPFLCRTTLESIPPAPYLSAPPRGSGGVGIAARGNPGHINDAQRSLPEAAAAELWKLPGAIDLDPASTGAQDLQDTAEIIAGLDLVIAVDTAIAHLAGALGKRCFLLLPHIADWRWLRGRDDSPWYPSLRLFRQPSAGDWASVLQAVHAALPGALEGREA